MLGRADGALAASWSEPVDGHQAALAMERDGLGLESPADVDAISAHTTSSGSQIPHLPLLRQPLPHLAVARISHPTVRLRRGSNLLPSLPRPILGPAAASRKWALNQFGTTA